MPGLFGIMITTPNASNLPDVENVLFAHAKLLKHFDFYKGVFFSIPGKVGMGKIDLGKTSSVDYYETFDGRFILFQHGNIYNVASLEQEYKRAVPGFQNISHEQSNNKDQRAKGLELSSHRLLQYKSILSLYFNMGWDWLSKADGRFFLLLYDRREHCLELVSDFLGTYPIYYFLGEDFFAFSCELASLLQVSGVSKEIDPLAVQEFFTFGFMLEDRTWFKGIKVFPPGTIFRIRSEGITQHEYWSLDRIQPKRQDISQDQAIDKVYDLWTDAIESRLYDNPNFAVTLSGGLDSRAILASIPDRFRPVNVVNYGIRGCDDNIFAKKAAAVKGDTFHFREIFSEDWLERRFAEVLKTGGLLNLLHMHPASIMDFYRDNFDVILNGFLGDAILGGYFMGSKDAEGDDFAKVFRKLYSGSPLGMSKDVAREYLLEIFNKCQLRDEIFLIRQRLLRFVLLGVNWIGASVEARLPFAYKPLVDFCLSLPLQWRKNYCFYHKFLLTKYSAYYIDIPWQETGHPISVSPLMVKIKNRLRTAHKKIRAFAGKGIKIPDTRHFYNYKEWLRKNPASRIVKEKLMSKEARWTQFLDADKGRKVVENFLTSVNYDSYVETIGLMLTMETFFESLLL